MIFSLKNHVLEFCLDESTSEGKKINELTIIVPPGTDFSDLKFSQNPVTGGMSYEWKPIEAILNASNIDITLLTESQLDNIINNLLVVWYRAHRQLGGDPDPINERLISESDAEKQYGGINVISGAPEQ